MFAGLLGLGCNGNYTDGARAAFQPRQGMEGGKASATAGCCSRKRIHRRPGYMRGELPMSITVKEGERRMRCINNEPECPGSEGYNDVTEQPNTLREGLAPAVKVSLSNQQQPETDKHTSHSWHRQRFVSSVPHPPPILDCSVAKSTSSLQSTSSPQVVSSKSGSDLRLNSGPALQTCTAQSRLTDLADSFSSSFSFIRQSLSSNQRSDSSTDMPIPEQDSQDQSSLKHLTSQPVCSSGPEPPGSFYPLAKVLSVTQMNPVTPSPKLLIPVQPQPSPASQAQKDELVVGERVWHEPRWGGREVTSDLPDCDALSVDSDTASASSVTSGYESGTPASDQGWDNLLKRYEGILQDCLQNNRTNAKIESMMLKLQRLQQKAILDDDYDTAERFGKKLEELCRERGALKLGLPSRQPSVALFLERLRKAVHSALQRSDHHRRSEGQELNTGERSDPEQNPLHRRDRLIQEKRIVEAEIAKLQRRLTELKDRSHSLEQQILQQDQQAETEELEGSMLRGCTADQLTDMSRALQDLVTSENRMHICVSPPPSMLRLQEQEQALNLSIKEATAKVVMSQRLGGSLRRKVSETETQLLALHEAKLAAISGNDFSSAKELKAEMKAVYLERDRLEGLAKRLHSLSSGNSQELARMKEQQQQLRQELEQREAQHENRLKENTSRYIELLEDRLHSCGCPALERVWEADLEACHLFLRGVQLRTPSCSGPDGEELLVLTVYQENQPCTKDEEDCAMLTALGGRWCPDANLQNSEFTKDDCSDAEAVDLTEQCELISNRLVTLEDELQKAIRNRDQALTECLEKEVQEVKATLQTMLAQLKEEDDEAEGINAARDDDLVENGIEDDDEEEEEDQYFSDSWDI
ncbi:disrupted in schizophrenia 1 protein isoform X2 [Lampris incognitus]|uniref:disrupted in schizophrenia 1 protein isoform X2 n=1 Tax=Lampris incognitus TaxID=2546036 RepID=UPI0024B5CFC0|nr:disrupted in schizophrenia 1 protein isoform X2 [Lampris incognitus]